MKQELTKLKYMNLKEYLMIALLKEWTNKYIIIKLKLKILKKNINNGWTLQTENK